MKFLIWFSVVGIMWGIPAWLVLRAWRKYRQLNPAPFRDLTAVRVSIVSLMISAAMLLLLGAVIAVQSESRAMAQWELSLRYVGLTGLTLCAISFLVSFLMVRETEGEIRTWKAIAGASAYLFFVWLFAITAH